MLLYSDICGCGIRPGELGSYHTRALSCRKERELKSYRLPRLLENLVFPPLQLTW